MKKAKALYVTSFVLFFIGQSMNFSFEFQLFHIFSIVLVIFSGLMVYRKSGLKSIEIPLFVSSFASLLVYGVYVLFFGFLFNSFIELFLYVAAFMNMFFLFRVLSLRARVTDHD